MNGPWWSRVGTVVGAATCLLAALGLLASVGVFIAGSEDHSASDRRRQAGLRPPIVVDYVYWLVGPIVDMLADRRVRPNHVTAAALGLAALTGLALAGGYLATGVFLLIITGGCDLLDGYLARTLDRQSKAGAFFDSFADRLAEGFILGGLAYHGGGGLLTWLCLWALVASLVISYARARGEGLGVDGAVGLMQRPERIGLIIVVLAIAAAVDVWPTPESPWLANRVESAGIGLLAVLATGTAIRRAWSIFAELRTDEVSSPLDPGADSES